jgi:ATP-dependent exoDNAse (exonuclease V) alpha subunit
LANQRAKLYVAITRAKYSVAIISNFADGIESDGVQLYYPNLIKMKFTQEKSEKVLNERTYI